MGKRGARSPSAIAPSIFLPLLPSPAMPAMALPPGLPQVRQRNMSDHGHGGERGWQAGASGFFHISPHSLPGVVFQRVRGCNSTGRCRPLTPSMRSSPPRLSCLVSNAVGAEGEKRWQVCGV